MFGAEVPKPCGHQRLRSAKQPRLSAIPTWHASTVCLTCRPTNYTPLATTKAIWRCGTTDNYSTRVVSSSLGSSQALDKMTFWNSAKRFYLRTNKIAFTRAITRHRQRERLLHRIRKENRAAAGESAAHGTGVEQPSLHFVDQEPLPSKTTTICLAKGLKPSTTYPWMTQAHPKKAVMRARRGVGDGGH